MRKHFITLIVFIVFSALAPKYARADYNSAYQDQVYNYQVYKAANNSFQVAKSSYLTYRTLTAQNDAIDKFHKLLSARDSVMSSYYNLLQEKMNATAGVTADSKSTFNSIKDSEKSWLDSNQKSAAAAASFEDLNSVSAQFEKHYLQMDTETKQAIGTIEMAKLSNQSDKINTALSDLSNKLTEISASGEDTNIANRGIISSKSKLDLFSQKLTSVRDTFYKKDNGDRQINLFDGQRKLIEANQYLRETTDYLLEIVKSFTG